MLGEGIPQDGFSVFCGCERLAWGFTVAGTQSMRCLVSLRVTLK